MKTLAYGIAVGVVLMTAAWYAGAHSGITRCEATYEADQRDAVRSTDARRVALIDSVKAASVRVDTVTVTVARLVRRVDTAWQTVHDTVITQYPEVADAKAACLALSQSCSEQAALFAAERAVRVQQATNDSAALVTANQRVIVADRRAQTEANKAWRRRMEGAALTILTGLLVERVR